jgi:tetratricopeptide (TPR) repeat protein
MAALQAVGLRHFFPVAHFHLGEALMRLGEHARAAEAFEVALAQQPGLRMAHVYLSELYRNYLDAPQKAAAHLRLATEDTPHP